MVLIEKEKKKSSPSPSVRDFCFGTVLGEGSFAKVYHAQFKKTKADFAVKVMDQEFIKREKKVAFVITERHVMSKLSHPRIVKFFCSFKDSESLYMVMEMCRGGELLSLIQKEHTKNIKLGNLDVACSTEITQFYIAELVEALEYIHSNDIVHRDLKPDNILICKNGHLKVTDFGTAKDNTIAESQSTAFCGTAEYVSPEVLNDEEASPGTDLWALGCIIYQMFTGRILFHAGNDYLTFQKILNHSPENIEFPSTVPESAQDLCRKLLVQKSDERLGAGTGNNGYESLKAHPFFDGIEWNNLSNTMAPVMPTILDFPKPTMDGAVENWSISEFLKEVQASNISSKISSNGENSAYSNEDSPEMPSSSLILEPNERITFQGRVKLHSAFINKSRQLFLTSEKRLLIADLSGRKIKKVINSSNSVKAIEKTASSFEITTPTVTYRITDNENGSQPWCMWINKVFGNA